MVKLVRSSPVRFRVEPGDIPPEKVARRLHLTLGQFEDSKDRLFVRGFPKPDPDTGMYDLEAVDRWRHLRHSRLFPELTSLSGDVHMQTDPQPQRLSMGDRFASKRAKRDD